MLPPCAAKCVLTSHTPAGICALLFVCYSSCVYVRGSEKPPRCVFVHCSPLFFRPVDTRRIQLLLLKSIFLLALTACSLLNIYIEHENHFPVSSEGQILGVKHACCLLLRSIIVQLFFNTIHVFVALGCRCFLCAMNHSENVAYLSVFSFPL